MFSNILGSTKRIEKNQFASHLLTKDYIKVHQLALELRGGNHPCERRAESKEQRVDFGEQKSDILLINL